MNGVLDFAKMLVELVRLRCGPADMPHTREWIIGTSLVLLFLFGINDKLYEETVRNFLFSFVRIVFFGFLVYVFLRGVRLQERWLQTATALYGAALVLEALRLVLTWIAPGSMVPFPLFWVHQAIGIWYLVVSVSILKKAMEVGTGKAILISFGCGVLPALLGFLLIGPPRIMMMAAP